MFDSVSISKKEEKFKIKLKAIQRGREEYAKIKEVAFVFGEPNYFVGYSNFTCDYFPHCERFPTMGLKYISREDAHNFVIAQNKLIEEEKCI